MKSALLKLAFILCSTLGFQPIAYGLYLIFDAGGVLINTRSSAAFKQMGYGTVAQVALRNMAKLHVFKIYVRYELLFKFLHGLEPYSPDEIVSLDHAGVRLPQIMCRWLKGEKTGEEILRYIHQALQNPDFAPQFKNEAEKNLISAMAHMMFTPHIFASTQELDPAMKAWALKCHERGLKLVLHSAWDEASFACIKQTDPEFWALFENRIFLSGTTGLLKPDLRSYTNIMQTLRCNPDDCAFIDDVWSNVQAARDIGMYGIHYRAQGSLWPWIKNKGIDQLEHELQRWLELRHCI